MKTDILAAQDPQAQARALAVLRSGGLVAFPTDTVYGVGALAFDAAAVSSIYTAKDRPVEKAIPVLIADPADLEKSFPGSIASGCQAGQPLLARTVDPGGAKTPGPARGCLGHANCRSACTRPPGGTRPVTRGRPDGSNFGQPFRPAKPVHGPGSLCAARRADRIDHRWRQNTGRSAFHRGGLCRGGAADFTRRAGFGG